jgi:hypothetical protein
MKMSIDAACAQFADAPLCEVKGWQRADLIWKFASKRRPGALLDLLGPEPHPNCLWQRPLSGAIITEDLSPISPKLWAEKQLQQIQRDGHVAAWPFQDRPGRICGFQLIGTVDGKTVKRYLPVISPFRDAGLYGLDLAVSAISLEVLIAVNDPLLSANLQVQSSISSTRPAPVVAFQDLGPFLPVTGSSWWNLPFPRIVIACSKITQGILNQAKTSGARILCTTPAILRDWDRLNRRIDKARPWQEVVRTDAESVSSSRTASLPDGTEILEQDGKWWLASSPPKLLSEVSIRLRRTWISDKHTYHDGEIRSGDLSQPFLTKEEQIGDLTQWLRTTALRSWGRYFYMKRNLDAWSIALAFHRPELRYWSTLGLNGQTIRFPNLTITAEEVRQEVNSPNLPKLPGAGLNLGGNLRKHLVPIVTAVFAQLFCLKGRRPVRPIYTSSKMCRSLSSLGIPTFDRQDFWYGEALETVWPRVELFPSLSTAENEAIIRPYYLQIPGEPSVIVSGPEFTAEGLISRVLTGFSDILYVAARPLSWDNAMRMAIEVAAKTFVMKTSAVKKIVDSHVANYFPT